MEQPAGRQSIDPGMSTQNHAGLECVGYHGGGAGVGSSGDENFGVLLKTQENRVDVVGFGVQHHRTMPVLDIVYGQSDAQCPEGCFFECYPVFHRLGASQWKHSYDRTMYTFFVRNMGDSDVEVFVQISPDQRAVVDENAVFRIAPHQTEAIVPQTFAFFTRLAFRTIDAHAKSTIKVWFQPVVDADWR